MPNARDRDALEFMYQTCIQARYFEITQLVARNNFFMVFQGVLLAGLAQASSGKPIPVVSFLICTAGVASAVMQILMASGAKFWQERWESELERVEKQLLSHLASDELRTVPVHPLFSLGHQGAIDLVRERLSVRSASVRLLVHKFSVSRIPIFAGISFLTIWMLLLLCTVAGPWGNIIPSFIVGFPPAATQ
jgi:hypothetical protein